MELTAFLKLASEKLQAKSKSNYDEENLLFITLKKLINGFDHNIQKEMAYVIYDEYKDKISEEKWANYFFDLYHYGSPTKKSVAQYAKYHEYLKDNTSYKQYIIKNAANFRNFINKDYLQDNLTEYNNQKEIIDFLLEKNQLYQFDTILAGDIEENYKKINSLKNDLVKGISPYTYDDYLEVIRLFREKIDNKISSGNSNSGYVYINPKFKDAIHYIARDAAMHPFPNKNISDVLDILKVDAKEIYNSGYFDFSGFLSRSNMNQINYWDNITQHDSYQKKKMFLSMSGATDIKVGVNYRIAGALLKLFEHDTEKAYFACQYFKEQIQNTLGLDITNKHEDSFMVLYDYIQLKKGKTNKITFTQENIKNFTMVYEKLKLEHVLSQNSDKENLDNNQSENITKKRNKL
jgi:hypothetical protein